MTIVTAELVFAEDRFERSHALALQGGLILATGTEAELRARFPGHEVEDWGAVAILPGCVNAHAHAFESPLRGRGADLTAAARRELLLGPFLAGLDTDVVRAAAVADFGEMARAGVTTVVESFPHHDRGNVNDLAVVEAARQVGLRIVLARGMTDWEGAPKRSVESAEESVRNLRELTASLQGDTRAFVHPAPDSIEGASPETILAAAALARELDVPFHIHVSQTRQERDRSTERHGVSPVAFLDSLGVLSASAILVDCVWVDEDDLALIAERGAAVVHQPSANAFGGLGVAPLREMLLRRIPVGLGSGAPDANGRRNVFDEMRTAALLAKAVEARADGVRSEDLLLAGTARGGHMLGLPVGTIASDHAADLVVVDLNHPSLQPSEAAEQHVVYSMRTEAIRRVIVGGEVIAEDGLLTRASGSASGGAADAPIAAGRAPE